MSWVWHNKKTNHREPDWNAPVPDASGARLEYLYAWERRCRGYTIHPYPVALEPPYLPYEPEAPDGYARLSQTQALPQTTSSSQRHLSLELPLDQKVTPSITGGFLSSLQNLRHPLAFEIVADSRQIAYQLTAAAGDAQTVESSARMHWPKTRVEVAPDLFQSAIQNSRLVQDGTAYGSFVVDFGLLHFAYLPLSVFESFAVDPLAGILE